jgi:DNA-binding HxlR family transcriptional regulator
VPKERRSYDQFCGIAKALDVVGERWTLLMVRDLLLGPRRYGDLLAGLPGITTNLLAKRLKQLEAEGLVERTRLPAPATSSVVYRLTPSGRELEPALHALGAWGWRYMQKPKKGDRLDVGWLLFSLKRRFRGATRTSAVFLRADSRAFHLRVTPETWDLEENRNEPFDAVLESDGPALRALFFRREPFDDLVARGRVRVTGDSQAVRSALAAVGAADDGHQ